MLRCHPHLNSRSGVAKVAETPLECDDLGALALAGRVREFGEAHHQRCAEGDLKQCQASIFGDLRYESLGIERWIGASGFGVEQLQLEDEECR